MKAKKSVKRKTVQSVHKKTMRRTPAVHAPICPSCGYNHVLLKSLPNCPMCRVCSGCSKKLMQCNCRESE